MKKFFSIGKISSLALLFCVIAACQKDNKELNGVEDFPSSSFKASGKTVDVTFYALADGLALDKITTANPETVLSSVAIMGLQSGEKILAIDFRPATGQLYGLGSTSRLYVINPETGVARMIGTGPFSPALSGSIAGFDFNPTVDRIRVVTTSGQNLRLNPETGAVAFTDGSINGVMDVEVAAVAYTNNMAGASTTILYDIDIKGDRLLKQTDPNMGIVTEVGPLKIKVEGEGGFDIAPNDATALGLFEVNKKSTLFRIDLATGETRIIAKYKNDAMYSGIAIPTLPVAYAVSTTNKLMIFNPTMPGTVVEKTINVPMGVNIFGIDFRPKNGQLYALGSNSMIYTINASSGAATSIATLTTMLSGTAFGFDFNPVVDRIRIVSNTGQNLRFNPADNTVINDGILNFGMVSMNVPMVTAAAYSNNFAGTTTTTLFDIETTTDKLYRQVPPNSGGLVEIGSLGVNVDANNGFDIGGMSGAAWALLTSSGTTKLYMINLSTGAATASGDFNSTVNGFTVGLGF